MCLEVLQGYYLWAWGLITSKKITENFSHYFWKFCVGGISYLVKSVAWGAIELCQIALWNKTEVQTEHTSFLQGVSTGQSRMQMHILHVRSSRGTEADVKNWEGEREVSDFHDSDALQRIPLAIDRLDLLKGRPSFFPCLRRHSTLVNFLNKLHTSQCDCVFLSTDDNVNNIVYHQKSPGFSTTEWICVWVIVTK